MSAITDMAEKHGSDIPADDWEEFVNRESPDVTMFTDYGSWIVAHEVMRGEYAVIQFIPRASNDMGYVSFYGYFGELADAFDTMSKQVRVDLVE
jgi:hypothetical protein